MNPLVELLLSETKYAVVVVVIMPTVTVTVTVGPPVPFPSPARADCELTGTMLSCPPDAVDDPTAGTVIVIVVPEGLVVNTEGSVSAGDTVGVAEALLGGMVTVWLRVIVTITTELVDCDGAGITVGDVAVIAFGVLAELDTVEAGEEATVDALGTALLGAAGTVLEP